MGRSQQRVGAGWEDYVWLMLGMVRPRVYMTRNYPEMRWTRGGGYVVTGTAVPDLTVVWQGVVMVLDLKSTANKNSYSPYKDQVHQFEAMSRADEAGALAGYLVEWREWHYVSFFRVQEGDVHREYKMRWGAQDALWVNLREDTSTWMEVLLGQMLDLALQ